MPNNLRNNLWESRLRPVVSCQVHLESSFARSRRPHEHQGVAARLSSAPTPTRITEASTHLVCASFSTFVPYKSMEVGAGQHGTHATGHQERRRKIPSRGHEPSRSRESPTLMAPQSSSMHGLRGTRRVGGDPSNLNTDSELLDQILPNEKQGKQAGAMTTQVRTSR